MASCQQCNNLLPRTVDRCPVCGVAPAGEIPESEFAPPPSPGWAPAVPSLSDRLANTPAEANMTAPEQAVAPSQHPPAEPTDFLLVDPIAQPAPPPPASAPDPMAAAEYQPPAAQMDSLQNSNYKRIDAPAPVPEPTFLTDEDIVGGGIPGGNTNAPPAPDHDEALRDRTVRAQSARIEGVSLGEGDNHKLVVGGMLGVAVLSLAVGTLLSLSLLGTEAVFAEVAAPTFNDIAEEGETALAEQSSASVIEIRAQGCARTDTSHAFMPDDTTVVVPYSQVLNDAQPILVDTDGNSVLAEIIYADAEADLAVLRARSGVDGAGLGWSGATQASVGATLLLVETSRSGEPTTSQVQVVDRSRNNEGQISEIVVSETGMQPGAVALDAQGRLVGMVDQTGDTLISAEALRQLIGEAKARPGSYSAICPEPVVEETDENTAEADG